MVAATMPVEDATVSQDEPGLGITIRYEYPPDLRTTFSDTAVVQHTQDVFYLTFFQSTPPVQSESVTTGDIVATCVARIALTPDHARRLLVAFAANMKRHDDMELHQDTEPTP